MHARMRVSYLHSELIEWGGCGGDLDGSSREGNFGPKKGDPPPGAKKVQK